MRWWVPGVNGLVGRALKQRLGVNCIGSGKEVDIANKEACDQFFERAGKIDGILNCAAFSKVDHAEVFRDEAMLANGVGPEVLGQIAKEKGIKIIHLSTDYVFSGKEHRMMKETDIPSPCNHYGLTKLEGEKRLLAANPHACVIRTSWVFGAGGNNFASMAIAVLQKEPSLKLVSDQISRPTYVKDLIDVMLKMKDAKGIYHFANRGVASKFTFATALREELLKRKIPVACERIDACLSSEFNAAAARPAYTPFDTTKIEQKLGIVPRDWHIALSDFVEDYVKTQA